MKKPFRYSTKGILYSCLFLAAMLITWVHSAHCQAIAPAIHPQFLNSTGAPLSNGFLYSYIAGTTGPLPTYADPLLTIQNPNPIPLDATGAPSNGSGVQVQIWMLNDAYKFCAYDANMVQQWCSDNVATALTGILAGGNTWQFGQTFAQPILITAIDNQILLGGIGNQLTLDFPPPIGNATLHFPTTGDTMVGRATTDTLTNKTLTSPVINTPMVNGINLLNGVSTGFTLQNAAPTGTQLNTLTKVINTGGVSALQIVGLTDTAGSTGIVSTGAGVTGSATVITNGIQGCFFDGAVTGGDYIQISNTVQGACHDAGASWPTSGQVVGRALQSGATAGTWSIELFGSESRAHAGWPNITSIAAGTGAGTGPTLTCANCTDAGGIISLTTGSSPATTNATLATLTLSLNYSRMGCTVMANNANAAALGTTTQISAVGNPGPPSTLIVTAGSAALTGATPYSWNYTCSLNP